MTKKFLGAVKKALYCGGAVAALVVTVGIGSMVANADTAATVKSTNVNIRSSADATSSAVGTANTGDKITIVEEKTGADGNTWYKIKTASGTEGYIRSDFVTKGDSASTTTTTETTNVTSTDAKTAYVAGTSKVNIRKNASTTSDLVASAQGKSEVTIIGEATSTDGYKWYQIEFTANGSKMQGYIRSDLVTFTAPTQPTAETEISGTLGEETPTEEAPVEEAPVEETPVEEEPVEETPASETASALTVIEPSEDLEVVPAGYKEVEVKIGEDTMRAWANGDFYILYGYEQGSDPQWYVYDYKDGKYLACEGLFAQGGSSSSIGGASNFVKVLLVVLVALVVILAIIVAVLAYKLANNDGYNEYDDFDDYDDDDYVKPAKKSKAKKEKKKAKKSKASKYVDDDDEYFDDDDFYEDEDIEPVVKAKTVKPAAEPKYTAPVNPYLHEGPVTSRVQTVAPQSNPYLPPEEPVYTEPEYVAPTAQYEEPEYVAPAPQYVEPEYVAPQSQYEEPEYVAKTSKPVEPEYEDIYFDDEEDYEEEEYVTKKSKKDKKAKKDKKSKKGFGQKLLDYFTVEVDDEDEDYDEYDDEYDDDDDDMDFIDV